MCVSTAKGVRAVAGRCKRICSPGTFYFSGERPPFPGEKVEMGSLEEGCLPRTLPRSGSWVPLRGGGGAPWEPSAMGG